MGELPNTEITCNKDGDLSVYVSPQISRRAGFCRDGDLLSSDFKEVVSE